MSDSRSGFRAPRTRPARHLRPATALLFVLAFVLGPGLAGQQAPATPDGTARVTEAELAAFAPRELGPAVTGGRITDVAGVPGRPSTLYVATASGGLWKTVNRGHRWTPLFDDQPVSAFGAVAVAPSDPEVVWAGTGEQNNRQSVSWGDGVYRSEDGGATWRHVGLEESRHVGKIAVHPTDPEVAWVAALGNLWAPSAERGVFRTTDGGETWEKVLFVDDHTGAVDLALDPSDPDVLYAATYQRMRKAWGFRGGGPGSGLWKSVDGGDTWERLEGGIPTGDLGRIGVAVAPTNRRVVMATVQTADDATTGTYRSEDGGRSWERVNTLNPRPMYYSEIFVDPTDDGGVWVLGVSAWKSDDGGRTFEEVAARPTYDVGVHADHHALWIDPSDPDHLWLGGDGGLHHSYDGGRTFRKVNNLPVGQFYAVGVDMAEPYRIYGGMQDNHSWMVPHETRRWIGIIDDDWRQVGFSDGMFWDSDPTDPTTAYGTSWGGTFFRVDTRTGGILDITPRAPEGESYRFDWTSPLLVSRHDPSTVHVGGARLFTSRDRGDTWTAGPDLSRGIDRDTLELGGVAAADFRISPHDGTPGFGETTALAESPLDPDVLWVGMDDGTLQVTRDGGAGWTEVSDAVPGLPEGTYVSRVVASRAGAGVAWVAFDAHRDGDFAPYVYRTDDFGRTWQPRHGGLPAGSVNALAEHPDDPDVLFLGTEHALWVTTDAGAGWARLPGLPTAPVDDLIVHPRDRDLVVGTHGRGIWVVDDVRPLAGLDDAADAAVHLFAPGPGTLLQYWKDTSYRGDAEWHGENPPDGVPITYRLGPGDGPALLRVTAPSGRVVREMRVPATEGVHRVTWDLRHGVDPTEVDAWEPWEHAQLPRPTRFRGPLVSPGVYTVTLEARDASSEGTVEVRPDPEAGLEHAQYLAREAFMLDALAVMGAVDDAMAELRGLRSDRDGATGDPDPLDVLRDRLVDARRQARGAYSDLAGSGARQGTLHPPTSTQRSGLARARAILEDVRRALDALDPDPDPQGR